MAVTGKVASRIAAQLAQLPMYQLGKRREEVKTQVAHERADRFAEYVKQLQAPAAMGVAVSAMPAAGAPSRQLRILAEGDSWFEYPLRGPIIGSAADGEIYRLEKLLGYPIANMAHHG